MAVFSIDGASDYGAISMSDAIWIIRTWFLFSAGFWILSGYYAFYTIAFIGYSKRLDIALRNLVATAIYIPSCALFYILIGETLSRSDVLTFILGWGCVVAAEVLTNRICRSAFRALQAPR